MRTVYLKLCVYSMSLFLTVCVIIIVIIIRVNEYLVCGTKRVRVGPDDVT